MPSSAAQEALRYVALLWPAGTKDDGAGVIPDDFDMNSTDTRSLLQIHERRQHGLGCGAGCPQASAAQLVKPTSLRQALRSRSCDFVLSARA